MKNKKTLSISEARKNIYDIAEDVQKPGVFFTLTEKGVPKAVMLSAQQFDSLMEDLEIMSDPKTIKNIELAEAAYKRGDYYTWDELKSELGFKEQQPFMVADKPRFEYGVKKKKRKR